MTIVDTAEDPGFAGLVFSESGSMHIFDEDLYTVYSVNIL